MRPLRLALVGLAATILSTRPVPAGPPTRTTADIVVEQMKLRGIPVCFERVHHQKDEAISLRQRIDHIQKIPEAQRTSRQATQLQTGLDLQAQGIPADTIVGWQEREIDFAYPDPTTTPEQILEALVLADPAYRWEKVGTRYLLYPKEGSFNCPQAAFTVTDASFDDLLGAGIKHIFQPAKLNYLSVAIGRPWTTPYEDKTYSFHTDPTDARTALTAFCDAIGPHIVWAVRGCDPDWLNLSFSPVYPPSGSWN